MLPSALLAEDAGLLLQQLEADVIVDDEEQQAADRRRMAERGGVPPALDEHLLDAMAW